MHFQLHSLKELQRLKLFSQQLALNMNPYKVYMGFTNNWFDILDQIPKLGPVSRVMPEFFPVSHATTGRES